MILSWPPSNNSIVFGLVWCVFQLQHRKQRLIAWTLAIDTFQTDLYGSDFQNSHMALYNSYIFARYWKYVCLCYGGHCRLCMEGGRLCRAPHSASSESGSLSAPMEPLARFDDHSFGRRGPFFGAILHWLGSQKMSHQTPFLRWFQRIWSGSPESKPVRSWISSSCARMLVQSFHLEGPGRRWLSS